MEEVKTVATEQPAAAPVAEPAPAPQADAADAQETVSVGSLMANKNAADKPAGSGKPAAQKPVEEPAPAEKEPPKTEPAPEKQADQPAPQAQKDIDAAIGKRIGAERRKWEKDNAHIFRLAKLIQETNPEKSIDQLIDDMTDQRDKALGISPALAKVLQGKGLLGAEEADDEEAPPDVDDLSDDTMNQVAERWGTQAEGIAKFDKGFDFEKFMTEHQADIPKLVSGETSLTELWFHSNIERLLQEARDEGRAAGQKETVDNIRGRNGSVPAPQTQSAPGDAKIDWANMSTEEFKVREAEIKRAQAQGKRVTMG